MQTTSGISLAEGDEWILHRLGNLYSAQGRLDDAEAMYERALRGQEKVSGPEHTSTLDTVNNPGLLYKAQGRLDDAEAMYAQALQGSEKALGPEHTSTLDTVNSLGLLYLDQGRLDDPEAMYERALRGYEIALGPERVNCYTRHSIRSRTLQIYVTYHSQYQQITQRLVLLGQEN